MNISVGILIISDRCYLGIREDKNGPVLKEIIENQGWIIEAYSIVPDNKRDIGTTIKEWCDEKKIPLILTCGGTGIGPRDITPGETLKLIDKELPGVAEFMRHEGQKHTPFASLSRAVAGIRKNSFIINLPGTPSGVNQCLQTLLPIIPHAFQMMNGKQS